MRYHLRVSILFAAALALTLVVPSATAWAQDTQKGAAQKAGAQKARGQKAGGQKAGAKGGSKAQPAATGPGTTKPTADMPAVSSPPVTKKATLPRPSTPEAGELMAKAPELREGFFVTKDGYKIHYLEQGKGPDVLLIHGFTSSGSQNWCQNGNMAALAVNHHVVAIDCLNHGESDKPTQRGSGRAQDAIALLDHLKIAKAHIAGYSMGGGETGALMRSSPDRFITATFAGSAPPAGLDLAKLNIPVMVINGSDDGGETRGARVKEVLKDHKVVSVPGRGHMNAPSHPLFISSMVEWINTHDPKTAQTPAAPTQPPAAAPATTPAPTQSGDVPDVTAPPVTRKVANPNKPSTDEAAALIAKGPELREGFFKTKDGYKIHYLEMGKGPDVVMIHGLSSSAAQNWFQNGNMSALAVNHHVVAIDCLNHGESDKPSPRSAGRAQDVVALMDHLQIKKAHVAGYSMGGAETGQLLRSIPDRFITATFAGSDAPGTIELGKLNIPMMVINGENDRAETKGTRVAAQVKDHKRVSVPGRGHMDAPSHSLFLSSMVEWVNSHDPK